MSGVSKEQIAQAREVDLLAYLQTHEPDAIRQEGPNSYRHREHESLVYFRDYWFWNQTGKRMNALDYLVEIRGIRFVDAVETLCGVRGLPSYSLTVAAQRQSPPKPRKPFSLPWAHRCATQMLSYLQERGIHADVISRCLQNGSLYQSRFKGYYKNEYGTACRPPPNTTAWTIPPKSALPGRSNMSIPSGRCRVLWKR